MIWYPRSHDVETVRFFMLNSGPGTMILLTLWRPPGDRRWILSRFEGPERIEITYVSTEDVPWILSHPEEALMETLL